MLDDLAIRARQNIGLVTAILLFCIFYLLYNLAHPKGFSSAVLVQNGDEIFALAMLAMAQTVPVLASADGVTVTVGAVELLFGAFGSGVLDVMVATLDTDPPSTGDVSTTDPITPEILPRCVFT